MRIYTRTNGVYYLDYEEDGKRRRVSLKTKDKDLAQAEAVAIMRGGSSAAGSAREWTLADALRHSYELRWANSKGEREARYRVNLMIQQIGETPLSKVTHTFLREYVESQISLRNVKGSTMNRHLAAIGRALKDAKNEGKLSGEIPELPKQREYKDRLRWLNAAEEERLLTIVRGSERDLKAEWENLIVFLIESGCRLSEALKAQLDRDAVLHGDQLRIEDAKDPRGRFKVRTITLTPRGLAAFESGWPETWNCKPASKQRLSREFRKLADKAELYEVGLHTMRHTAASRMVQAGIDLYRVGQYLGHSSVQTTMRYAHLAPDQMRDVADVMSRGDAREASPSLRLVR